MSRDDHEFAAYLAARWPLLVRTLVLLKVPTRTAHELAADALSRLYPDFARLSREEDVEVEVYRELFDARHRYARHGDAEDEAGEAVGAVAGDHESDDVPEELTEAQERLAQLQAALDSLSPDDREVVVLLHVAELSDDQVSDILDRDLGSPPRIEAPDVHLALEAIPVEPLHVGDVAELAQARRRRLWTRTGGVIACLVILGLVGMWVVDRLDRLGDVEGADNPLPVAWYAGGTLHLADVRVGVRPVRELVAVPDGIVLTNDDARVIFVESDGDQQQIGRTVTGSPLVVEPDNGWVAWADPGNGDPELVVYDTRIGDEVGRRSLAVPGAGGGQPVGEAGPIAIDDERVYYRARGNDFAWEPLPGDGFAISGELLDWANGAQVHHVQGSPDLLVQSQPYDTGTRVAGESPRLSADGRYLMVVLDEDLVVYDTTTGLPLDRMHSPSDRAVSWTYAGDDTFLITVLHKLQDKQYQDTLQMPDEGDYRIYECIPGRDDTCVEVHRVERESADPPVLAR
jgi:DNA-directed RNA polymerase specialized sigma24 family protein